MSSLAIFQTLKESILSQASVKASTANQSQPTAKRSFRSQKSCMGTAPEPVRVVSAIPVLGARAVAAVEEYGLLP